jgi:succinate dehydrogenase / fumarate reductase flavoprotein subunit
MANATTYTYDVLVIGAGGAGLRAAIEAANSGVSVGLICKSLLGKAHTVMAEGGMAAAMGNNDDRDNWKVHFADTMRGGQYVNNWRMAEIHAKEAPDRVRELEGWGAVFDRTKDGRINQRNFGGHRYPRLAHVGDRTGLELIRTLQDHTVYLGATVHMEHTVIELMLDGGKAAGVVAYDRERGRFHLFAAKAIILATGGAGRAYKVTSNSWEGTGDGIGLAYRAGAELIDMEFVQFHPTGMVWPPSVRGLLVTEGVRGEGGVLKNSEGRRFMFDDIPDNYKPQTASDAEEGWRYTQGDKNARRPPELLTRDHVARCINREVKSGRGSPHGGVYLDIAWIKEKLPNAEEHIKRKLPSMYHQFKELADLDITKEPMEIGPTMHYMMGGIRVDGDSQMTTIPGLVRGRGMCVRHQWGKPAGRKFAVGPDRLWQARWGVRGAVRARHRPAPAGRERRRAGDKGIARGVRARLARRKPLQSPAGSAGVDEQPRRHRPHRSGDAGGTRQDPAIPGALDARRHRGTP